MPKKLKHLGIILDGNRRWAKSKGLPTLIGHKKGYEKIKQVGEWCINRGIDILTVYAFSTENWSRSKKEVDYLMNLLKKGMIKEVKYFKEKGIQVKVIGEKSRLSQDLQNAISNMEEKTKNCTKGLLNIAINYGGRLEIVKAVKKIIKEKIPLEKITEQTINNNLYTSELPDPDMIIRTSGEQRLSGFLLWQASYSELYFPSVCWPGFKEKNLDEAVEWFEKRNRRFGGDEE
ncbi:di-trans,poly-cis-decaprenylcistransferase [Candidatus Falkowbacteria bacterium]|jgi:undecaprenyl diphosphate synthase|nr:di-trans,poly-cis-decaprenylcistransferase [Candidatus Falkowbacteria bacterium]MBT4432752.1 di-trans,poly-cis-decaprenylcistransferase [Candidatus Falkowbacteria bacterium]